MGYESGAWISRALRFWSVAAGLLLVMVGTLVIGGGQASAQSALAELTVQVVDRNGVPTAGVEVTVLDGNDGSTVGNTVTDGDGLAVFDVTLERCYQVSLIAPDGIYFLGGSTTTNRYQCAYSPDGEFVVVETIPADFVAELQAQVLDQDGVGIADVAIVVERQFDDGSIGGVEAETTTGSGGQATADLGPGCYQVTFTAPEGWVSDAGDSISRTSVCVDGWSSSVSVFARFYEDTGLGTVRFVTFGQQGAVAGSALSLRPDVDGVIGDVVATLVSETDVVSLELPVGCYAYDIEAAPGYLFEENGSTTLNGGFCFVGFPNEAWITPSLRSANPMTTVYIEARRQPDFSPATGLTIDVYREVDGQEPEFVSQSVTDGSGTTNFDVTPGCYQFIYQAPDGYQMSNGEPTLVEHSCFTDNDVSAQRFLVLTPADVEPTLTVVANTIEGQPVSGVAIDVADESGQPVASSVTEEDGLARIAVSVGCFQVTATAPEGYTFVDGGTTETQRSCVDLSGGSAYFPLIDQNMTITGTLRSILADWTPVPGVVATVSELNEDGTVGDVVDVFTTDDVGHVAVSFGLGCFRIDVAAPDGYVFTDTGTGSTSWDRCFTPFDSFVFWELRLDEAPQLDSTFSVSARFGNGRGVGGVTIDVEAADGSVITLSTAANGTASTTLAPGCYALTATAPRGTSFSDGSTTTMTEFCVDGSGDPVEVTLSLQRGKRSGGTCALPGSGRPGCDRAVSSTST